MKIKEMSLEDSQLIVQALVQQLQEAQEIVDNKSRQVKHLSEDLDRAQRDEESTHEALKKILKPLVEERAALYLIHEDEVVRRIAKDILNSIDNSYPYAGELKKAYYPSSSRGR